MSSTDDGVHGGEGTVPYNDSYQHDHPHHDVPGDVGVDHASAAAAAADHVDAHHIEDDHQQPTRGEATVNAPLKVDDDDDDDNIINDNGDDGDDAAAVDDDEAMRGGADDNDDNDDDDDDDDDDDNDEEFAEGDDTNDDPAEVSEGGGGGGGGGTAAVCLPVSTDPAAAGMTAAEVAALTSTGKKKRLCRFPGCNKVIKSQGHCQRHGAKAKRCKVANCDKQAQGTHDGMCKRHWRAVHFPDRAAAVLKSDELPPPPEGESVYDNVLPASIGYRPTMMHSKQQLAVASAAAAAGATTTPPGDGQGTIKNIAKKAKSATAATTNVLTETETSTLSASAVSVSGPPGGGGGVSVMPLVAFLREGSKNDVGWHRNAERRARGLFPVTSLSSQLEPWERQLALVEILLLSGGTPYANFKDLAHAWGREKGFHQVLAASVCERRGEVERKRRSDAGRILTREERESFRDKLKKAKTTTTATATSRGPVSEAGSSEMDEQIVMVGGVEGNDDDDDDDEDDGDDDQEEGEGEEEEMQDDDENNVNVDNEGHSGTGGNNAMDGTEVGGPAAMVQDQALAAGSINDDATETMTIEI